jgi:hypothetical protein
MTSLKRMRVVKTTTGMAIFQLRTGVSMGFKIHPRGILTNS